MPEVVVDVERVGDDITITFDDDTQAVCTISVVDHKPVISGLTSEELEMFEKL